MADGQTADVGDALRALDLRDMADREEDRRFGQRVHGHVQQPGEIRERAAHAEGEGDDAHVLDRRIGEQPFDVAPPVEHERREHQRHRPIAIISGPGVDGSGLAASSILKRSSAYSATLSSRPDSTAEIGVGPSACASGSQACNGASPTLVP